jgi:hypothetical protein
MDGAAWLQGLGLERYVPAFRDNEIDWDALPKRWPVILHRTPYGITATDAPDETDISRGWLPSPEEPLRGSILWGWRNCSLVSKTRERQLQFRDAQSAR